MTATIRPIAPGHEPATPFQLTIDLDAGRVAVHGDFDRLHVERFVDAIRHLEDSPSPTWSVDLAGVTFCDAGGLRALLAAQRLAAGTGRSLRLTGAGPWMCHLLPMIGLASSQPEPILRSVT